ncbi:acyl carrier protein [Nocardia bovistercoris]|uniref:Acyl carrier protein n=1 Tax=Nocardia bovistercoris TaxID=2785916 RepID=A0A931IIY6_9NOCA|nr:acyl carrier protein [Nocardia bovistercoris]MBH0780857.1 acyl carrier protein [Nocardia bovistercoris]
MSASTDVAISAMLRTRLARRLGEEDALSWLSDTEPLAEAGVDSILIIGIVGELEQQLGVTLGDDAVLEAATIGSLAAALSRGERS